MVILVRTGLTLGVLIVACADVAPRGLESQVVFRDSEGRELTLDDLEDVTGQVNYEIVGSRDVPVEATRLHELGRLAGSIGQAEEALALFAEAASLAPDWPYPHYDAAFTYLLKGDFSQALAYYRRTVALAPQGFFTAFTAVQALEQEEAGVLPVGTYLVYSQFEGIEDPAVKEARAKDLLARAPAFAPAWKELAVLLPDDTERLEAIRQGLASDPDPETQGILLMNQAIVLFNRGDRDDAISILGSLALDPASSLSSVELAKALLATMLKTSGA